MLSGVEHEIFYTIGATLGSLYRTIFNGTLVKWLARLIITSEGLFQEVLLEILSQIVDSTPIKPELFPGRILHALTATSTWFKIRNQLDWFDIHNVTICF